MLTGFPVAISIEVGVPQKLFPSKW